MRKIYDIIPPEVLKAENALASHRLKKELLRKIISLVLIISFNWTGFLAIGRTFAYFSDSENSNDNIYQTGILDFSLSSPGDFAPVNLTPCQSATRDISIVNNLDSNLFQYTIQANEFSGELCDYLNLSAQLDGIEQYNGSLTGFNHLQIQFSEPEDWNFTVSLNDNSPSLQNKNCQFKFIFDGWQSNLPNTSLGFSDKEEIVNNVMTGDWFPEVTVTYPNGGEVWYIIPPGHEYPGFGMYEITWEATSPVYNPEQLNMDIWFCKDSGNNCFYQLADDTENDGSYWWTIPYDSNFVTHEARIKIIVSDPCNFTGEDMSDTDFCPPLLSLNDLLSFEKPEKIEIQEEENVVEEAFCKNGTNRPCGSEVRTCQGVQICEQGVWGECIGVVLPSQEVCDGLDNDCNGEVDEEGICNNVSSDSINLEAESEQEEPPVVEVEGTSTGEELVGEEEIIEEESVPEEVIEEEPVEEKAIQEEPVDEEVIEEEPVIEEPAEEEPAIEEQPATLPEDDTASFQDEPGESGSDNESPDGGDDNIVEQ